MASWALLPMVVALLRAVHVIRMDDPILLNPAVLWHRSDRLFLHRDSTTTQCVAARDNAAAHRRES